MATKETEELNTSTSKEMEETGINENPNMKNPEAQKLTEKGEEYHAQIREMKEKAFVQAYKKFKQVIVYIRNELKKECSEDQLYLFMDTITDEAAKAIESYDMLRSAEDSNVQPMSTYRRQADTIEACTKDLITFINSALMELGVVEFNIRQRRDDLRTLKKPYTASIYSQATAVSQRL